MLVLPFPYRRAWLRSFWATLSLLTGLLMGVLLSSLISPQWIGVSVVLAVGMALPGLLRPLGISKTYRAWNKLAAYFAHGARFLVMGICFYTVLIAVGRAGRSLRLTSRSASESGWVLRRSVSPDAYLSQYDVLLQQHHEKGWIRTYLSWSVRSGNLWAASLLPFLILAAAFDDGQPTTVSSDDIYTLY